MNAPHREVLSDAMRRIDKGELARRIVEAARVEIPGYERLPDSVLLGQVLDATKRNLEMFQAMLVDGRPPSDGDLEPLRESARTRATEGMPLEDLMHAYRLGTRLAWDVVGESIAVEQTEAFRLGSNTVIDYVDRVCTALIHAYLSERQHLVSEEERALRALLRALLADEPIGATLQELAERKGMPRGGALRPFAACLADQTARSHAQLAARLRSHRILALTEGNRVAGLARPEDRVAALAGEDVLVAVGEPAERAELAEAMGEIRRVVDLGQRLGLAGEVTSYTVLPELLVQGSPRLAALLERRVLEPLDKRSDRGEPSLLETLSVAVECELSRQRIAERLHIHPNTVDYRLRKVEELTDLRLRNPHDLALLSLALRWRRVTSGGG